MNYCNRFTNVTPGQQSMRKRIAEVVDLYDRMTAVTTNEPF